MTFASRDDIAGNKPVLLLTGDASPLNRAGLENREKRPASIRHFCRQSRLRTASPRELFSELPRRHALMPAKNATEVGDVSIAEFVSDLRHIQP